jgi:hypothetical protein
MDKSKISFYFIFIAFFSFLAIFLTIAQASYNNLINPTKQIEENKFLEPLNPVLDSEIIQEIEKRQSFTEGDEIIIVNNTDLDLKQSVSPDVTNTPTNVVPTPNAQTIPIQEDNN